VFNLQGSEIIIILLLALVVLGPEKLPDAMRKAGQFYAELKKMSSGFQNEFRAAVEEPLREIRETANVLRDSADFTKLQSGERDEKPKSAEMAGVEPATAQTPSDDIPTFETTGDDDPAPELAEDSKPPPFTSVLTRGGRPVEPAGVMPDEPAATEEPATTNEPAATEKPAKTEKPVAPEEPATTEEPLAPEESVAVARPALARQGEFGPDESDPDRSDPDRSDPAAATSDDDKA
jgi:sec-independent protein translocase protein TatB